MTEFDRINGLIRHLSEEGLIFQSPWLTTRQAARYCKLSESYLAALRSKGGGPKFTKQGRVCLYHKSWLDQWLDGPQNRPGGNE
ncbi:MAG: helix-turn-helix domain-containing protein [Candidatus Aenigmarchaeota archaeon]|nr:helix-turn-helix domain-containing protein [Candidatus Aenigmarchaeota archaeon]